MATGFLNLIPKAIIKNTTKNKHNLDFLKKHPTAANKIINEAIHRIFAPTWANKRPTPISDSPSFGEEGQGRGEQYTEN